MVRAGCTLPITVNNSNRACGICTPKGGQLQHPTEEEEKEKEKEKKKGKRKGKKVDKMISKFYTICTST